MPPSFLPLVALGGRQIEHFEDALAEATADAMIVG